MDVRDIEELVHSAPEELTEDDLLEMTGPEMLQGTRVRSWMKQCRKISSLWRTWRQDSGYLDRSSTSSMIRTPLCYVH
ncbi:hypothetical protein M514_09400 [Trichuris suis]|uniref:Uncharacterized protein n=1 Tax=Trichuris suis TaxID=68888 RepID=A0A085MXV8_9BILA|nr:hypothetical protein M513_09400 [Trichuris suis]KFD62054.1 hypothetical protein M514_09400 [Trichuris suis]